MKQFDQAFIFEHAPDGIVIADHESRYLDANPKMCQMLGYTRQEMVCLGAADIVAGPDLAHIQPTIDAIRASADFQRQWRLRRKDGSVFTADVVATLMPDGNMLATVRDVTEAVDAQFRIQHLNRVFDVLSHINQAITRERDPEKLLPAVCAIAVEKGQFRMAWIGMLDATTQTVAPVAFAGATGQFLENLQIDLKNPAHGNGPTARALLTGEPQVCNDIEHDPKVIPWREGALQDGYRSMAAFPLLVGGAAIGVFGVCADVPGFFDADELHLFDELAKDIAFALDVHRKDLDRQRVDRELRDGEERFRQLAENIDEVFWLTDIRKRKLLYLSPSYESIWGRPCQSVYDSPRAWLDAIHPDDRERVGEAAYTTHALGGYDQEYRIVRPDGELRWIRDRAFPVRDASGDVFRVAGVAQDMTSRKQLEAQFRQSQKMEAVGRLAGGVAHDFNNLLTAILGYSEMLTAELGHGDPRRDYASEIQKAATSATALTHQLLAFSRKQVMEPTVVDLNDVVSNMQTLLGRVIGEDVAVCVSLSHEAAWVRADRGQMEQVVLNLAVNARDAMPSGGVLTIETAIEHGDVKLRVTDTGTGMTPDVQAHVFEPFFTTKEAGKGTGLGLATVYGVVTQYGGNIQIETKLGKGTSFVISLPKEKAGTVRPVLADMMAPRKQALAGTETVLIVEDTAGIRQLSKKMLERLGYRVLLAADGEEALQCCQSGAHVDVVLTDIVMPDISGLELAKRLEAVRPELKVIFMSGYTDDTLAGQAKVQAGTQFLQKPFTAEALSHKIRETLDLVCVL